MKIYLNSYFLRMIMICNWPVVFWWQSHSYLRIKKQFFIYVTMEAEPPVIEPPALTNCPSSVTMRKW